MGVSFGPLLLLATSMIYMFFGLGHSQQLLVPDDSQIEAIPKFQPCEAPSIQSFHQLLGYLMSTQADILPWMQGDIRYTSNWTAMPGQATSSGQPCIAECMACEAFLKYVKNQVDMYVSPAEEIVMKFQQVCEHKRLPVPKEVCQGFILNNMPTLMWTIKKNVDFQPSSVCAQYLGIPQCNGNHIPDTAWSLDLPGAKPAKRMPKKGLHAPVKMVHVTDMHFDNNYDIKSESNCNGPICCRSGSMPKNSEMSKTAGKYGSYKCDTPVAALEDMMAEICNNHADAVGIIFTGDIPPHDVWNQSRDLNTYITEYGTRNLLQDGDSRVHVFPALGNHEVFPANLFSFPELDAPESLSTDYIYSVVWDLWKDWLPADQEQNVRKGGFFTALLQEGLRIIALNTNFCFKDNWFIWAGIPDPSGQLKWLVSELQKAEENLESVFIIGHIPPSNHDCMPTWSLTYAEIVWRFEDTIRGQFFGHTHHDEFTVYRDHLESGLQATNVAFIAPSMTAYRGLQPSFRVFHLEPGTDGFPWIINDYETWTYDLADANRSPDEKPRWVILYSMKDHFGLPDLEPQSFLDLALGPLQNDSYLWESYHRFFWSDSPVKKTCDQECKRRHLCLMLYADTSKSLLCIGDASQGIANLFHQ